VIEEARRGRGWIKHYMNDIYAKWHFEILSLLFGKQRLSWKHVVENIMLPNVMLKLSPRKNVKIFWQYPALGMICITSSNHIKNERDTAMLNRISQQRLAQSERRQNSLHGLAVVEKMVSSGSE
jgi:hypothetical protein